MDSCTRVFVYGTLKPGGRYHEHYCGGFRYGSEAAKVAGWLFDFPRLGYPGAMERNGRWIQGQLLTFSHSEKEILTGLDELEGYDPQRSNELNEYDRKKVPVYSPSNLELMGEAWCYFMELQTIETLQGIPLMDGIWHA